MCVLHLKKQHEGYSIFHNAGKTFKFCIKKSINLHSLSLELDGGRGSAMRGILSSLKTTRYFLGYISYYVYVNESVYFDR